MTIDSNLPPNTARSIEAKNRKLKKYEALPQTVCQSDGVIPMDFFTPFGPMIAKLTFPSALINKLNDFADDFYEQGVSKEFRVPPEIVFNGGEQSIAKTLESLAQQYVSTIENHEVKKIQLETAWVVSQCESTASPMHFHSSNISGVLYLKTPDIDHEQEDKSYISGRQAGYINFMIGGKQALSKSLMSFKPEVGDCYIFPGWLLHGVEPFSGTGERRSMAFNLTYQTP